MRNINLSNKANSSEPNNGLHDTKLIISQSGTAGECLSLCFIGLLVMIVIVVFLAITGCIWV